MSSFGVTCVSKTRRPQCDIDKLIDRNNPALNGLAAVLNTLNTTSSATFPATGGIVVSTGDSITAQTTLTLASTTTGGNVVINSAGTGVTAVDVNSSGGITVDAVGGISIDSSSVTAASNFTTVGGAGIDLTIGSTAGSLILNGGEAAADAIQITTTNAAGGIDVNAGTGGYDLTSGAGILETYAAASTKVIDAGGTAIATFGTAALPHLTLNSGDLIFASATGSLANTGTAVVTQTTSTSTGLTANASMGRLTMFAALGAGVSVSFTVTCSACAATSSVFLTVEGSSAVAGISPSYSTVNIGAGSFDINVTNQDGANATAAALIIHFFLTNPA